MPKKLLMLPPEENAVVDFDCFMAARRFLDCITTSAQPENL